MEKKEKCAVVAIIGPTNAGKSSLVNAIMGQKLSIVTHKVQTTRFTIRGIKNHAGTQLVFIDTPGIFTPKRHLEKMMTKTAWSTFSDTEISMLVLDSKKGVTDNVIKIIAKIESSAIVVLNKIDLVNKFELLVLASKVNSLFAFEKTFMISANQNNGVGDIEKYLLRVAPEVPWIYSEGQCTDAPLEYLLSEITRKRLFLRIHQEIPYGLIVETEMIDDGKADGKADTLVVYQVIYVGSESHKRIIVGKNRATLESIIYFASYEMQKQTKKNVSLNLFVKVKKDWVNNPHILSNISY